MHSGHYLSGISGAGPRWSASSRDPPQRWAHPEPPPWHLPRRQWQRTASSACHLEVQGGRVTGAVDNWKRKAQGWPHKEGTLDPAAAWCCLLRYSHSVQNSSGTGLVMQERKSLPPRVRPFEDCSHLWVQTHKHQSKYSPGCCKIVLHVGNNPEVGWS